MIGRRGMVVRRRPLMRAAVVGGSVYAGRQMGRRAEQRDNAEADQDQRLSAVEAQQAQQTQAQQTQAQPRQPRPAPARP